MIDREEIERLERHHEHLNIRHRVLVRFFLLFFFPPYMSWLYGILIELIFSLWKGGGSASVESSWP